ncbi:MAG: hypothetical protein U0V74_07210 [Chitinophagales bacterium]
MRSLLIAALLFGGLVKAQVANVPAAFERIAEKPTAITYNAGQNHLPKGGHIQGIQEYVADSSTYIVLTGSSSSYSYYLSSGEGWQTQWGYRYSPAVRKLFDSPLRHAGGCQIHGKWLAVGIEDNIGKSESIIALIDLSNGKVDTVLERKGTYKRSTAGAVGYTKTVDETQWIAVGDWDSRHIDFYQYHIATHHFYWVGTYTATTANWPAFQSINLVSDSAGKLFLLGFSLYQGKNRADLFQVNFENGVELKLISTRYFKCENGTGFRFGAGVVIKEDALSIIASARNLKKRNKANIFSEK